MTKVSIVILNWNGTKDTLLCMESISTLAKDGLEVCTVVVDNASEAVPLKLLEKRTAGLPDFELIENVHNLGFAGGNNIGIKRAMDNGAEFVLVLNNDTVMHKNALVELVKAARKYPKVGAFTPKMYFAKGYEFHKNRYRKSDLGKVIWSAGGDMDWANVYGTNHGVDEVDEGQFDASENVDFASGAALLLRTEALERVGLFDERLFLYMEDVDLCIRLKAAGWGVRYVPKAIVWHKVSQSSGIGSQLNDYFITRNRLFVGMRYASLRTRLALGRESLKLLLFGRRWQRKGVVDAFIGKYGKGSWR